MTNEELMMPRYEVIADYPGCPYEIGTVLMPDEHGELYSLECGYTQTAVKIMHKEVIKFEHLVRPLFWYERRQPDEMPQYLKGSEFNGEPLVVMFLYFEYCDNDIDHLMPGWWRGSTHISCFEPATKEEYETYLSNKHKQKK